MIVTSNITHQPQEGWTYPVMKNVTEHDAGTQLLGLVLLPDGRTIGFRLGVADVLKAAGWQQ
jgi:hypothetical protein